MTNDVIDYLTSSFSVSQNTPEKVQFREKILYLQEEMQKRIADGELEDALPACEVTHHFAPIDPKFGCCSYARQMLIPKGTAVIGKIHRHQHLNFIMQGQVSVATEFGKKYFTAPCVFVSEVGLKRAVLAEEDTIWVTVHLTEHYGEEHMSKIEEEVISPSYEELNLISSTHELNKLTVEGEQV
jgi:hypothetical protein